MNRRLRMVRNGLGVLGLIGVLGYGAYKAITLDEVMDSKNRAIYTDINEDGLKDIIIETPIKYKVFLQEMDGTYRFTQETRLLEKTDDLFKK